MILVREKAEVLRIAVQRMTDADCTTCLASHRTADPAFYLYSYVKRNETKRIMMNAMLSIPAKRDRQCIATIDRQWTAVT